MTNNARPLRILQVVGAMNAGGTETWLLHVLRHTDPAKMQMDFLVHSDEPGAYDDEIRALGSRLIPCLHPRRPIEYSWSFRRVLRRCGPYDIVHSHMHHYSGLPLCVAQLERVPIRIAHSHNDTRAEARRAGLRRALYLQSTHHLVRLAATHRLAASEVAAEALFGKQWRVDPTVRVLHCGVDFGPIQAQYTATQGRSELGLAADALVLGHIGRFVDQKNHHFLLDILCEAFAAEPRARAVLCGEGPLRPAIEQRSRALGISHRVVFAGVRRDIPRMLRTVFDVLLLPSLNEGLPLVLMEAQGAAVPAIVADTVTREAEVVPTIEWLPLSLPASQWATVALANARKHRMLPDTSSWSFDIRQSAAALHRYYDEAITETSAARGS